MTKPSSVTVLGGGVSGITTAILLRLAGYEAKIITELLPLGKEYDKKNPRFQSVIAAASIIPHTIVADDIEAILSDSQAFFQCFIPEKIVRTQHHYEIFETPQRLPIYQSSLKDFQELTEEYIQSNNIPKRSGVDKVYGWHYSAYFAEMPLYLARLYELFDVIGGKIQELKLTKKDLHTLPGDILINCTGSWSRTLFSNPYPSQFYRGYLVLVSNLKIPTDKNGRIFSYNYTAAKEIYSTTGGEANDVYFYPRSDVWIVGGSRQVGDLDELENWKGDESSQPTVSINGVQVPKPVLELSKDILLTTTGQDITEHAMRAIVGYRYETIPLRIESVSENGRPVIHNYGHGGAGVTTSWGSALRVLNLAHKIQSPESLLDIASKQSKLLDRLQSVLVERLPNDLKSHPDERL